MINKLTVRVVVDNQVLVPGLETEHGLALWIEADNRHIVLDTGQGKALIPNARKLGLPFEDVSLIVLSHGHYDHTGGLMQLAELCPKAKIIMHPQALVGRYALDEGKEPRFIGMPPSVRQYLHSIPERVQLVVEPVSISDDIRLTGAIPRLRMEEGREKRFYLDAQGTAEDMITDDQALYFNTVAGLVVLLGCAHSGVYNSLNRVLSQSGEKKIHAVMGGLHLSRGDSQRIDGVIRTLKDLGVEKVGACHCTGNEALHKIAEAYQENCLDCKAGVEIRL